MNRHILQTTQPSSQKTAARHRAVIRRVSATHYLAQSGNNIRFLMEDSGKRAEARNRFGWRGFFVRGYNCGHVATRSSSGTLRVHSRNGRKGPYRHPHSGRKLPAVLSGHLGSALCSRRPRATAELTLKPASTSTSKVPPSRSLPIIWASGAGGSGKQASEPSQKIAVTREGSVRNPDLEFRWPTARLLGVANMIDLALVAIAIVLMGLQCNHLTARTGDLRPTDPLSPADLRALLSQVRRVHTAHETA